VRVLVVNPGSSSLKVRVVDDAGAAAGTGAPEVVASADVPCAEGAAEAERLHAFMGGVKGLDAAGVRFVHGGAAFRRPVVVDSGVREALGEIADLAPLHNPPALDAIRVLAELWPDLPVAACFDTAFFADLPPAAATFAVPRRWTEEWGVRRFGFHGLSHSWASRQAAERLGRAGDRAFRVVTAHLGAGASLAAVRGGAPVDTTMGFTPLDGLVMATRCGAVDPGVLVWAQRHHGLTVDDLERILDRESGLLGLSGRSGDMRVVVGAAEAGDAAAGLALDVYLHRLRGSIAAMAAALGGLDALAFTGGVGEHSAAVRDRTCDGLAFLGVGGAVPVLVVEAREDLAILSEVRRLLG